MQRNCWLPLAGIALTTVLAVCVTVCLLAVLLWRAVPSVDTSGPSAADSSPEPSPVPTLVRRQPNQLVRQTAETIAHTLIPQRDLSDLARRLQEPAPDPEHVVPSPTPPAYMVGNKETFWLHNVGAKAFFTATATLRYETDHAYWWVEDGYRIPQADLAQSANAFENQTYPTHRRLFGSEWLPGIDGDPHVYIYLGNIPGVGGYFSGPDEFSSQIRPFSNQHEMFYINLENARPGNDYFDGILAHEFQHMIHWALDRNEDTWVSEGLSELASEINGYDVGGSDRLFLAQPDSQLTAWPELEYSGPHYGASYLLLSYFNDQYGEHAIRQLVAEPANGTAGFDAVLDGLDPARRFDDLFADWLVANYLDDPSLAGGRYGYANLDPDPAAYAGKHTTFPARESATVSQYAADYILLEHTGPLSIQFTGSLTASLLGNRAHSGDYQWWSVRGDEGDTTLTRAFDLRNLRTATLETWMWYDLEADYDYAYVEISGDGGQTWDILSNGNTTLTNPSGTSYGPAFSGKSGGGDMAVWTKETFDLTRYAGQPVLVRFEVVTDDAVNRPGLSLDDISIPELGYHTDVETGADGWQAAGWARVTDSVPQRYLVQVITLGHQTRVQRLQLDEQMQGTLTLKAPERGAGRAVLVVSALAPVTTESAVYSYQIISE